MTYSLKDVFYLGNQQEYSDAYAASEDSIQPIDVSAYVNPISKGRSTKGTGLAVYRVSAVTTTSTGTPPVAAETGSFSCGLSVKPFTTTGERIGGVVAGADYMASSDLLIAGMQFIGIASGEGSPNDKGLYLTPTKEVPYVVVRDTIFQIMSCNVAFNADMHVSWRMECAMIDLDTATLNQLLRTQTA